MIYRHLRGPLRHAQGCDQQCAADCEIRDFAEQLNRPVLADEIAAEKAAEERWQALARGEFSA